MKLYIHKISPNKLSSKEVEIYHQLNSKHYGRQLAFRVVKKLKENPTEGAGLFHAHKDYCGMGLYLHEGKFTLGEVNDARGPYPLIADYDSEEEFMNWLASENDQSMSLYGTKFNNQTITKIRLEWYLEDHYSANWNAYCTYVRER